ncbi:MULTISPECIES: anti-repressor SinI family protein [Priestia]|uniref:anti-repressor SinI family protein n=1 Tax=Priestia TaxID=2800373 RepID=UPI001CD3D2EB|nr:MULTISPECIES: anti-repressor SinI family protein [Priestia]MCA1052883.1 anti-repressor SinI family protein [Priestia aryabhattai]WJN47488.1 anti-repressor SinI family protein [Priestia aryabhattai]
MNNSNHDTTLSYKWLVLVEEAMNSSVTKEEFKEFLNRKSQKLNDCKQDQI